MPSQDPNLQRENLCALLEKQKSLDPKNTSIISNLEVCEAAGGFEDAGGFGDPCLQSLPAFSWGREAGSSPF